ncbi:MAG: hypothetical protein M3328_02245, partial [Chloroflexota bacterium]|nr:hypothetical protein [Chloroflexota bacterium]
ILVQGGSTVTGGGQGYITAVVQGNTVSQPSANSTAGGVPTNGIRIGAGTTTGDNTKFCITLGGTTAAEKNTVTGTGNTSVGSPDIRVQQRFLTILGMPGYAGANNSNSAMVTYLAGRNNATTITAANNTGAGGPGFSGTCP